ncbi:knob-associated histidine-rich protein-like [Diorhabda sublineata]|uniref:knob-associated histidine-rich protein-like n=1 Tax=Diorhabda sublineata TaxID=1163346 RepID=UPI0024E0A3D6|nr:knob-associated histidine-rich protein-like [Diorhabda sublineata]
MSVLKISVCYMKLILLFCLLIYTESRYVTKNSDLFPGFVFRSSLDDLEVAAAEPRPVIIENTPEVLPLIADQNAFSDSPVSLASEKVEKILQRPIAFSYQNNDQSPVASNIPEEEVKKADVKEIDQKPAAVDYYKQIQTIESPKSDGLEGNGQDSQSDEEESKSLELNAESSDHGSIESNAEINSAEDSESGQNKVHEIHEHEGGDGHASESSHGGGGHGGGNGGGKDGGGNGSFERGGGQEHHSGHRGEKGEKGEKAYEGHHHNEKSEKGHHTKEDHSKEYEENGGEKKEHHHDDGYHAEHDQAEEGQKGSKFQEFGDHAKGHSTKGEHNIHRKDEYEKKQEFYDESDEEDEFEKDGGYSHEDEYSKGGFEKGSYDKGAEEEDNYGKTDKHEKGGYFKEQSGHKNSGGHDTHHDHVDKHGEKENNSGGKKWSYSEGTGGGGGGGHGHQHADGTNVPIQVIKPDQTPHSQNIPEPTYKNPDVLYPPLADPPIESNKPAPLIQVTYEDGFTPVLTPIQKRSDDNYGEGVKTDKKGEENKFLDSLFVKPYITETFSTKEASKEDDKSSSEEKVESSEQYKESLIPESSENSSDEIGSYSIFKLGDYTTPKPENKQINSSGSVIKDGETTIVQDESKQIEVVNTSMKPIVVLDEVHVI